PVAASRARRSLRRMSGRARGAHARRRALDATRRWADSVARAPQARPLRAARGPARSARRARFGRVGGGRRPASSSPVSDAFRGLTKSRATARAVDLGRGAAPSNPLISVRYARHVKLLAVASMASFACGSAPAATYEFFGPTVEPPRG